MTECVSVVVSLDDNILQLLVSTPRRLHSMKHFNFLINRTGSVQLTNGFPEPICSMRFKRPHFVLTWNTNHACERKRQANSVGKRICVIRADEKQKLNKSAALPRLIFYASTNNGTERYQRALNFGGRGGCLKYSSQEPRALNYAA